MTGDNNLVETAEPSNAALGPDASLAIVFGASEWPLYPDFDASPSCCQSAGDIADYLREESGLNLPAHNVKVLFDSSELAPEILAQMRAFIRGRRRELTALGRPIKDLLLYYVGHGGFSESDAFFLSVRSTDEDDPLATSISAESLGRMIRDTADGLRTYVVLDCCYAAAATKGFLDSGALGAAVAQLRDALPPQGDASAFNAGRLPAYGTALLCASGPRERARVPANLPHTMFTGGLLDVLREGDPQAPSRLSLNDIQYLVEKRLKARFLERAVLPQVYVPQQRMGRLDVVPLFSNPAHRVLPQPVSPGPGATYTGPRVQAADPPSGANPQPKPAAWIRRKRVLWIPLAIVLLGALPSVWAYLQTTKDSTAPIPDKSMPAQAANTVPPSTTTTQLQLSSPPAIAGVTTNTPNELENTLERLRALNKVSHEPGTSGGGVEISAAPFAIPLGYSTHVIACGVNDQTPMQIDKFLRTMNFASVDDLLIVDKYSFVGNQTAIYYQGKENATYATQLAHELESRWPVHFAIKPSEQPERSTNPDRPFTPRKTLIVQIIGSECKPPRTLP